MIFFQAIKLFPLLFLFSFSVLAAEIDDDSARVLWSVVSPEFNDGVNAAVASAVARKLGKEIDFYTAPFARSLIQLANGTVDFRAGLHRNAEREEIIHYVEPPYQHQSQKAFFILKNSPLQLKCFKDLSGLHVATSINARYHARFDDDSTVQKIPVQSVEQKFEMLLLGRVDAVIHTCTGAVSVLKKMGIEKDVRIAAFSLFDNNPVYIGISRKSPLMEELSQVEPVIREMIESGELNTIIQKKYPADWEKFCLSP